MFTLRRAEDRGHANHGWLESYHSFSFADYYDPKHMGFRSLRVINEDRVEPGKGFGTHSHRDMEIISYVLEGGLEHRDSMQNGAVIRPGDVQTMSAGTGVTHSEFNASRTDLVHFLQIWLLPAQKGIAPSYEQKTFSTAEKQGRLRLVASPDGRDGSVTIHTDARLSSGLATGSPFPTKNWCASKASTEAKCSCSTWLEGMYASQDPATSTPGDHQGRMARKRTFVRKPIKPWGTRSGSARPRGVAAKTLHCNRSAISSSTSAVSLATRWEIIGS